MTYERAKKLVEAAERDPEKFGHLPAQRKASRRVSPPGRGNRPRPVGASHVSFGRSPSAGPSR
jgi:hypothetical protein